MSIVARPKAILFDWDNTLVNTWPIIHTALCNTLEAMGQEPWSMERTKADVRSSMRDSFPVLFGERWEEAAELYQSHFRAIHLLKLEALPKAEDVLRYVKDQGWYNAVVSNKKGVNLRKELVHIGWDKYFDKIVGAEDAARDKPHADPVYMALEGSNMEPGEHIWFIGDSEIDLHCAQNTGCLGVLYGDEPVQSGAAQNNLYGGFHYAHHVPHHDALLALMGSAKG